MIVSKAMRRKSIKYFLKEYDNYKKIYNKKNHQNILQIREVIYNHPSPGEVKNLHE